MYIFVSLDNLSLDDNGAFNIFFINFISIANYIVLYVRHE